MNLPHHLKNHHHLISSVSAERKLWKPEGVKSCGNPVDFSTTTDRETDTNNTETDRQTTERETSDGDYRPTLFLESSRVCPDSGQ
jgi:hypothetical protein